MRYVAYGEGELLKEMLRKIGYMPKVDHRGETHKKTKGEVHYGKGMPESNCGICRYFLSKNGLCKLVQGSIEADMWCTEFKEQAGDR